MIIQPHIRLIISLAVSLLISQMTHIPLLLGILSIYILLLIIFNKSLIKPMIKLNIFTLGVWIFLIWQPNGALLSSLITLKFNIIILTNLLIFQHFSQTDLVLAMRKLHLPQKLIYLAILMVRYISLFQQIKQQQEYAMKARGFRPHFSQRLLQLTTQRITLLLINALERTETCERALKMRGFYANRNKEL